MGDLPFAAPRARRCWCSRCYRSGYPARAELRLDITSGTSQPLPIAIPPFPGAGDAGQVGRDIAQVVAADLERSGLFRPVDQRSFIQTVAAGETPRFADWRQINAQALVTGSVQPQGDGRLRVEFRLWDVFAEQQLAGFAFTTTRQNWRRIAHVIADQIYKRITGEDGYFDTRIVYIAESGPAQARVKRLAIMDQDGANHQYLTDGRSLVLTPRFSPSAHADHLSLLRRADAARIPLQYRNRQRRSRSAISRG